MRASPKWVATGGGPLILVPVEVALHWRGTDGIGPSSKVKVSWGEDDFSGTDYGRACGVDDYLGVLACGPGDCLILGDEPMQTTFLPMKDCGLIVRWMWAECEEDVLRAVRSVPENVWEATPHRLQVGEGDLLLFDSAYPGDDLPKTGDGAEIPWLKLPVPRGTYEIDTADYQPDERTRLILHRLRRSCGSH
jgi:hypothetical protein